MVVGYDPTNPKGHYNTDLKVPQSVIDQIVEMGMAEALRAAQSPDASPEFVEGVNRFFPNQVAQQAQDDIVVPSPQEEGDPSVSAAEPPEGGGIAAQMSPSAIQRRFTEGVEEKHPGMLEQLMGGQDRFAGLPEGPSMGGVPMEDNPSNMPPPGGMSETLGNLGGAVGQGMDYTREGYGVMRGLGDKAIRGVTGGAENKLAELLKGMLDSRGHM